MKSSDREIAAAISRWLQSTPRAVSLAGRGLRTVPAALRETRNVQRLNLSDNALGEVPPWIGELRDLEVLGLSRNRLQELPEEIGNLQKLQVLFLAENRLKSLPKSMLNLSLTTLALTENPELRIPASILNRPPQEILRYYFEALEDARPLLELKLLLVGRGKAGKTTLVKRLAGEEPSATESETHSIAIHEFPLRCPKGVVQTRAWDFGGQEILHSTHQFFLTERSLYVVVLEPRSDLAQRDAEYWLKLIQTQGGGSPAIVVMNWSRGNRWRIDEVKLRRKFPFIVDFVATDALHGDGIDDLRALILNTLEQRMPDVWLPFPSKWRQIKDAVAGMKENFLTYDRYERLCHEFGEDRPDARADLAGILHALGLALYFGKDPRLHDTRVLNPSWVTGGVYAVIRSQSVAASDGQLSEAAMPRVLREAEERNTVKAADYPPPTHGFILELMRAFQLCYASEEGNGRPAKYLVPELLPKFEPEMQERWDNAEVRLRYRYELIPPGLLPRFIVRTHSLSDGAPHWRHGVVLRHAEAKALIREESDRNELRVFVLGGDAKTRQVLAAMVRRELQALHTEMSLRPAEDLELSGDAGQWISVKALREVEDPARLKQLLPVQPEGTADVSVARELDKLVPTEVRAVERNPSTAPPPVRLFVSYAREDERQLRRLDLLLEILEQQHGLTAWRDQRLIAGDEWDAQIRERLEEMDIFLFIASAASIVRPYIRDPEIRRALERHADGEVEIATVKLEPCGYDDIKELGTLQRLARRYDSIADAEPRSRGWEEVRKDLEPVIQRARDKRASRRLGAR